MRVSSRAVAFAAALLVLPLASVAGQLTAPVSVGSATVDPVASPPVVSASSASLARLLRAAGLVFDRIRCTSTECSDTVAVLRKIAPAYEAGGDPEQLEPQLVADMGVLARIVQSDANTAPAFGEGGAFYRSALGVPVGGPSILDQSPEDACDARCDHALAGTAVACQILPPPFDAACSAGAFIAWQLCLQNCSNKFGGIGPGQGYNFPIFDPIPQPDPGPPHEIPAGFPAGVTGAQLKIAASKLALRFSASELQSGVATASAVLGAQ